MCVRLLFGGGSVLFFFYFDLFKRKNAGIYVDVFRMKLSEGGVHVASCSESESAETIVPNAKSWNFDEHRYRTNSTNQVKKTSDISGALIP